MILYEPIDSNHARKIDTSKIGDDYIHWFNKQASVNLWYYTRLILKINRRVEVSLPGDSIFSILDPEAQGDDFIDNRRALVKRATLRPSGGYINIYVVGHAEEPGEFIDEITIGGEVLNIGLEAYDENEVLGINLRNMGIELSTDIDKALYKTDLYEERPDWVVLNNKWRELLINYMDIAGGKGNYKSLVDSLEWFGYGRLVELRECWKFDTPGGIKMMDRPIHKQMVDWYQQSVCGIAKTTYMVLRHLTVDLEEKIGEEVARPSYPQTAPYHVPVYLPYSYDPERIDEDALDEHDVKWAKDEMRLKMTLLGMFFESNFMPIHLDLLRSSVEDIVFDTPGTVFTGAVPEIETNWSDVSDDIVIMPRDTSDREPDEDGFDIVLHLDQQNLYGYSLTPHINFGINETDITSESDAPIIGVAEERFVNKILNNSSSTIATNLASKRLDLGKFNSIGAVAGFIVLSQEPFTGGTIYTNAWGEMISRSADYLNSTRRYWVVDVLGNPIKNDHHITEPFIMWQPDMTFYKQIRYDQYAVVNEFGIPIDDERYREIGDGWLLYSGPENWLDDHTYYIQTSSAKYAVVNEFGQQINDELLTSPPEGASEWVENLCFIREFYQMEINLLYPRPGEFVTWLDLKCPTRSYVRKLNIKVVDNLDVTLEFYALAYFPDFSSSASVDKPYNDSDPHKNPFSIVKKINSADYFKSTPLVGHRNMFATTRSYNINKHLGTLEFEDLPYGTNNQLVYEIPQTIADNLKYTQFIDIFNPDIKDRYSIKPPLTVKGQVGGDGRMPRSLWTFTAYMENGDTLPPSSGTGSLEPHQPNPADYVYYQNGNDVRYLQVDGFSPWLVMRPDNLDDIEGLEDAWKEQRDLYIEDIEPWRQWYLKYSSFADLAAKRNPASFWPSSNPNIQGSIYEQYVYSHDISRNKYQQIISNLMELMPGCKVITNLAFFPELHAMVKITGPSTMVNRAFPIVAVPKISAVISGNVKDLTWSHSLDRPAWKFYSYSTARNEPVLEFDAQQPIIASDANERIPLGMYKVEFSWRWGNQTRTITTRAPFNIVE